MLDKARQFIQSRKGKIDNRVYLTLDKLLKDKPYIKRVWLAGSYANGDWADEDTPEWFREFRMSYGKKEFSDIDFITEPKVPSTDYCDILEGCRSNKILIYDNAETII